MIHCMSLMTCLQGLLTSCYTVSRMKPRVLFAGTWLFLQLQAQPAFALPSPSIDAAARRNPAGSTVTSFGSGSRVRPRRCTRSKFQAEREDLCATKVVREGSNTAERSQASAGGNGPSTGGPEEYGKGLGLRGGGAAARELKVPTFVQVSKARCDVSYLGLLCGRYGEIFSHHRHPLEDVRRSASIFGACKLASDFLCFYAAYAPFFQDASLNSPSFFPPLSAFLSPASFPSLLLHYLSPPLNPPLLSPPLLPHLSFPTLSPLHTLSQLYLPSSLPVSLCTPPSTPPCFLSLLSFSCGNTFTMTRWSDDSWSSSEHFPGLWRVL